MDNWFKSKWVVRAVSLVFAIIFFVFVNAETSDTQSDLRFFNESDEQETVEDVPVEIEVDSDNYVVSGVPESVDVTLEGPKSVLTQTVQLMNFTVFVDLQDLDEGEHTVEMDYEDVPSELDVYFEPKEIDVTIEERASKEFDVTMDFSNTDELPEGFELGDSEIDPEEVTITSSKSVIEEIALVKVFLDVSDITESVDKREVPVNVYDNQGNELRVQVEPENVAVSVDVDNPSKEVPVEVSTTGELSEDLSLESTTTNVDEKEIFATSDVLDGIDSISTEEIALDSIETSETVEAELDLPDGVSLEDEDPVEVALEVEQTKTIDDVPIQMENESDDQDVTFEDPEDGEMSVEIVGDSNDVDGLSEDDIDITVDVSDLDEGEHDVPVDIEGPDGLDITGEIEDVTINVDE